MRLYIQFGWSICQRKSEQKLNAQDCSEKLYHYWCNFHLWKSVEFSVSFLFEAELNLCFQNTFVWVESTHSCWICFLKSPWSIHESKVDPGCIMGEICGEMWGIDGLSQGAEQSGLSSAQILTGLVSFSVTQQQFICLKLSIYSGIFLNCTPGMSSAFNSPLLGCCPPQFSLL